MKIYTDYIDVELTVEEFEDILNKGMLTEFINIIASLSERMRMQDLEDAMGEINSLVRKIISGDVEPQSTCRIYHYDPDNQFYEEELDEDNETVNRIYYSIFENGVRRYE